MRLKGATHPVSGCAVQANRHKHSGSKFIPGGTNPGTLSEKKTADFLCAHIVAVSQP
jgi:hypothetical protein